VDDALTPTRQVVWPGSTPAVMDPEKGTRLLLEKVGPFMHRLPVGEGIDWIVPLLKKLADHPDLEVVKEGGWTGYDDMTRYRIKDPKKGFRSELIDVGIQAQFEATLPLFLQLCCDFGLPEDVAFQIGVKGIMSFAVCAFGPVALLRPDTYTRPFLEATVREINEVARQAAVPLDFQLEVPIELVAVAKYPEPVRSYTKRLMAKSVVSMVNGVSQRPRFGLHACWGDYYHKAAVKPRSAAPLVAFVNEVCKRWPANRLPLDYIHLPLGLGEAPPPADPRFYQPLRGLRVPAPTLLVAGLLHEKQDVERARTVLDTVQVHIDTARRKPVEPPFPLAVGTSCGGGRISPADFRAVLDQGAALCTHDLGERLPG
jgi:hypothetical protein